MIGGLEHVYYMKSLKKWDFSVLRLPNCGLLVPKGSPKKRRGTFYKVEK